MRLWTLNPCHLDVKGLVAQWREALLARAVLENKTKGYKQHSQLIRFKKAADPILAINSFLNYIYLEANNRGYKFDKTKLVHQVIPAIIPVTKGQVNYEVQFLINKLKVREPSRIASLQIVRLNPIFFQIEGGIESWEKTKSF